jgi:quinol-cytochrome oxidoreductase complex cytochrome b subunit/mono/diheme cytochrome c family protein
VPASQTSPGFWEERTGWSRLKQLLFLEPLPGGARWSAAFGSLLLVAFLVQVVTGVLLAMNYAPAVETAWPSVNYIQEEVPLGAFIRGVHHWGSSAMVILLLFHLVQVFVWGAYKKPRELTWMTGVLLLGCVLGLAFTGYLLPWDQKAYWATKVGLGILSTTPVVGDDLRTLLQGGEQMGNLTLTRFFTLHAFILPGAVILLVIVHLYLFRLHGVTPSWWESAGRLKQREEPFWPKQVLKDGVLALVFLAGLGLWSGLWPAPLEEPANPAEPYAARPEWYFMFLFQALRYFEGPSEIVGTFVLPSLFFLILLVWPFLDRNPERDPRRRPVAMTLLSAGTMGMIGLTVFALVADVRMREPALAARPGPPAERPGPIQRADVAKIYNASCAACHAVDGTAALIRSGMPTIPDFTSMAWQMSRTDLEITHRIHDGNEPLMPAYRDKLSATEILALSIYVRAFSGVPPARAPGKPTPLPVRSAPLPGPAALPPAQIYLAYCLGCHDADGRGKSVRGAMSEIPDFTSVKWQNSRKDSDLLHSILEGKGKLMLPMKDKLSPADAKHLVSLVRQFEGEKQVVKLEPKQPSVTPTPVEPTVVPEPKRTRKSAPASPIFETIARTREATAMFRQYCLLCHGVDGKGIAMRAGMPAIPDFTNLSWQEKSSNAQLKASILEGKGPLMPAFRGRVGEEQARDLVAYVRAFGPPGRTTLARPDGDDFEQHFRVLQDQWHELHRQLRELSGPGKK